MSEGTHTSYDPQAVEAKRQAAWRERDAFRTPAILEEQPHLYIKPSAPFTSGNIHIGHVRSYSIGDAYARFHRARGDGVLFAFGFDAFGLPAELGAIASGEPPSEWVSRCATHMTGQLDRLGFSFDWERTFLSSDPIQYRWSQWLFLTLLDRDRFEGKYEAKVHNADTSGVMRRMVKESLLKFDATPLFPERVAYTVPYKLSAAEAAAQGSVPVPARR